MATSSKSTKLKLLSLNIRGLNKQKKRRSLFKWLKVNNVGVCFLQETYSSPEVESRWRNEWGGKVYFVHGTNHGRGVMILFKPGLDAEVISTHQDDIGRLLLIEVKLHDVTYKLVNVYAPNSEESQLHFYGYLKNFMSRYMYVTSEDRILLGGDFNVIMNPDLDRKGGNHESTHKYKMVIDIIKTLKAEFEITDIWRQRNPKIKRFTWRRMCPKPVFSRLDYWFVSEKMFDEVEKADILPATRSDYSGIQIDIKHLSSVKPGRRMWKLNNRLLEDADYVQGIISEKEQWLKETEQMNCRMKWEYIKYKVRQFTMAHGKKKAKDRRDKEKELENKISKLEKALDESSDELTSNTIQQELRIAQSELSEIDHYKTECLIMRSRARWYEKGEKSTAYFLRLESRNKIKKTTTKLQRPDGTYTREPTEILSMQREFYKQLYTSRQGITKSEIQQYIQGVQMQSLNEEEQELCEGELKVEECHQALKTFAKNKAPGNDGITIEFYQKFWPVFGKLLVNALNEGYREGELTSSQRQAVITLLDKGKDRTLLKNWRPISLLNTDYKIATKALSNRIKQLLPNLINKDQVGYVQGRNILENIRTLQDIVTYTKEQNMPGMLICIDFEKAFDSVEWNFLDAMLRKYNFGSSFRKWVTTIYSNISSCIINNGTTS